VAAYGAAFKGSAGRCDATAPNMTTPNYWRRALHSAYDAQGARRQEGMVVRPQSPAQWAEGFRRKGAGTKGPYVNQTRYTFPPQDTRGTSVGAGANGKGMEVEKSKRKRAPEPTPAPRGASSTKEAIRGAAETESAKAARPAPSMAGRAPSGLSQPIPVSRPETTPFPFAAPSSAAGAAERPSAEAAMLQPLFRLLEDYVVMRALIALRETDIRREEEQLRQMREVLQARQQEHAKNLDIERKLINTVQWHIDQEKSARGGLSIVDQLVAAFLTSPHFTSAIKAYDQDALAVCLKRIFSSAHDSQA